MLTITDIIIILLTIYFVYSGWRKGFLRMLIGPICFTFFVIVGVMHFDLTRNIAMSLIITLVGTVLSALIINIIAAYSHAKVVKDHRNYIFIGSRLAGAALSVLWKGGIVFTLILLLSLLPLASWGYDDIQSDVNSSFVYYWLNERVISEIPATKNAITTFQLLSNPEYARNLMNTKEYKDFFENDKIKELKKNPDLLQQIHEKRIIKIITNPLVIDIIKDDYLMNKLSVLTKKIYEERVMLYKENTVSNQK